MLRFDIFCADSPGGIYNFNSVLINRLSSNADTRNQGPSVQYRHSGMPSAGIYSAAFLDSGQNRAGMTEG